MRVARILVDQFSASGDDAANEVGMAAQIFRPGMHDQVDAVLRRMLVDGRAEGAVDHADQAVLPGQRCGLFQVDNAQSGIGRRLQIQQLRIRTNGPGMLLVIGGVDERGLNAQLRQPLRQELVSAAIDIALRHDVIASLEQRQDGGRDRAHAGGRR